MTPLLFLRLLSAGSLKAVSRHRPANMRTRIILVLAFFALMLACSISTAYLLLTTPYTSSVAGFFYKTENGHIVVTTVAPGQTGLRVGDEIVEFNRQPRKISAQRNELIFELAL